MLVLQFIFTLITLINQKNNAINNFIEESINHIVEIKDPIFRELIAKNLYQI